MSARADLVGMVLVTGSVLVGGSAVILEKRAEEVLREAELEARTVNVPRPTDTADFTLMHHPALTCMALSSERSRSRRTMFLRMLGVEPPDRVPPGYAVNHIVPLRCGGCDVPSNMELMSIQDWKNRTGPERTDCGRHPGGMWRKP